ncbi:MAG: EF-P lysine aminoacylase GenX [Rhodospirillales bacterium]|nr:EF-P lysine aminoacylase GenX [Rhodospirillales bacterium]
MTQELPPWHPDSLARRRPHLAARARLIGALRRYFEEEGFVEVETPALQICPGMEPHLQAFATRLDEPFGQGQRSLYLHTSPELAMKKLLVAGVPRLYQLARVFRNGERAATHHPEFTMLEWYRNEADSHCLEKDCRALLVAALAASGRSEFHWNGQACDPRQPWQRLSVAEAFQRHAGLDLLATTPDPLRPDRQALAKAAAAIGIVAQPADRWEDLFFKVFLDRIEPQLGIGAPTLLHGYPLSMAALARPDPRDPRLADRFELYVCGLELANAFGELTDAALQRRRFEADQALKQELYGTAYPIDEDFLAALAHGLPPCSGIALGFDRLVMLASGAPRIDDVLWLPVTKR